MRSLESYQESIRAFLKQRDNATEDEIRFYCHLEDQIIINKAQQNLLIERRITAEWDEEKQDFIVRSLEV